METLIKQNLISHLQCSSCGKTYDSDILQSISECCNSSLTVQYHPNTILSKNDLKERPSTLWRYFEMLPVLHKENIVSLGEGMTPLLPLKNLSNKYDFPFLYLKDESMNPTGSFKSRGMSVAVSKAKELNVQACITPTAGNAGGAMAAYCAAAGMQAIVVMPTHTPQIFKDECRLYGAEVILVDGLISDCGKRVARIKKEIACFDMSTMKEPYRLEGKKTMGYEIAEQMNWQLPDVILYPTGGGTGLIGMWKAFKEMISMGWLAGKKLPRMIAVQAENCQPVCHTWKGLQPNAKNYNGKPSLANGLAVPHPFGEALILQTLRQSNGFPVAVSDKAMIEGVKELAYNEGLLVAPEGGAIWKALLQLADIGIIDKNEKILLLNTGSGYKYMDNIIS